MRLLSNDAIWYKDYIATGLIVRPHWKLAFFEEFDQSPSYNFKDKSQIKNDFITLKKIYKRIKISQISKHFISKKYRNSIHLLNFQMSRRIQPI